MPLRLKIKPSVWFGLRVAAIVSTAMLATLVVVSCSQPQAAVPASTATPASLATATPTAIPDAPSNEPAPAVTFIPVTTSEIAQLGELAPDFELELFGGGKVLLSDYRGDVVVLNFWASWCPPCRKEMPAFERTWQEYRDQGVVFVGVAVQDHEPDARAFAEETGVSYPIGMDWNGRIFQSYRPTAMPTTFLIDREGVVSRRIVSYANEAMLKIFLKGQLDQ